jgi:hypothetical protein
VSGNGGARILVQIGAPICRATEDIVLGRGRINASTGVHFTTERPDFIERKIRCAALRFDPGFEGHGAFRIKFRMKNNVGRCVQVTLCMTAFVKEFCGLSYGKFKSTSKVKAIPSSAHKTHTD